jgi:hypothetical protein
MFLWNRLREALDTAPAERPDNNKRRPGGISNKAAANPRCYAIATSIFDFTGTQSTPYAPIPFSQLDERNT